MNLFPFMRPFTRLLMVYNLASAHKYKHVSLHKPIEVSTNQHLAPGQESNAQSLVFALSKLTIRRMYVSFFLIWFRVPSYSTLSLSLLDRED